MFKIPSPAVAKTAFSAFERGVELMMTRNHIRTPPVINISEAAYLESPASYHINPLDPIGLIEIHSSLAKEGATPLTLGAVAHETGHLLSKHTIGFKSIGSASRITDSANPFIPRYQPTFLNEFNVRRAIGEYFINTIIDFRAYARPLVAKYKAQEHEADRIMTHLLGSKEDALLARRSFMPGSEWTNSWKADLAKTSGLNTKSSPEAEWLARNRFRKLYGTIIELEQNIAEVDLTDHSHVNQLIAQRNAATMHERT